MLLLSVKRIYEENLLTITHGLGSIPEEALIIFTRPFHSQMIYTAGFPPKLLAVIQTLSKT